MSFTMIRMVTVKATEVRNNRLSFRVHEFAEIHTNSIEIEVLSTHGLNSPNFSN